jgi:rod shape-determining protein MreD
LPVTVNARIRDWVLTLLFGVAAVMLQASVVHAIFKGVIELNLVFGMIIWLSFYKRTLDGGLLSFLLAFTWGAMSGTLSGVYMTADMSLYLACWLLRERFTPRSLSGQFLFSLGLAIFYKLFLLALLEVFVGGEYYLIQPPGYIAAEVLLNALFAPLIFLLFNKLKDFYDLLPDVVKPRRG